MIDIPDIEEKLLLADKMGAHTLVAFYPEDGYPAKHGNCFGMVANNKSYQIVNFYYENLEKLLEEKQISLPVKILPLNDYSAVIHDNRIPDQWYRSTWCEVCCPLDLLPAPQRLRHSRHIMNGTRSEEHGIIYQKI